MLAVNYSTMKKNLDNYCRQVSDNYETLIVTGNDDKSIVMISLDEWNALQKAARNAEYLDKIDKSMAQLADGKGTVHELIEVDS